MMIKKNSGQLEMIAQTPEEKYLIATYIMSGEKYETRLVDYGIRIHTKPNSKYLSVKQCAKMLEFNDESLRRKCRKGEVPHRKIGNRIFFIREEIESWIDSKNRAATPDITAKKIISEILNR